jgi:hypothetical protein
MTFCNINLKKSLYISSGFSMVFWRKDQFPGPVVLADTVDADLFETLAQEFNCSTAPEKEHSTPPDQTHMVRSQLSDPVPLPPVHVSHGNSTPTSVTLIVDQFPCGCPGVPIPGSHPSPHIYKLSQDAFGPCIWAPFSSQHDWEITCWAKMCGPTSSALVELLAIPKVCTCLLLLFQVTKAVWKVVDDHCLSYSTPKALNGIIDDLLPSCPPFQC